VKKYIIYLFIVHSTDIGYEKEIKNIAMRE